MKVLNNILETIGNTPIIKLSITSIAIKNSFSLKLIELFIEIMHRGVINVVSKINNIDIPSIPTL